MNLANKRDGRMNPRRIDLNPFSGAQMRSLFISSSVNGYNKGEFMKSILSYFFATFVLSSTALAVDPLEPLPESVAKKHISIMGAECNLESPRATETHPLGMGYKLFIVPCIVGAYQISSRAYMADENDQNILQVMVLGYNEISNAIVPTLDLVDPEFNRETGVLSTMAKGRSKGDCGQSSQTKISRTQHGMEIHTLQVNAKPDCDGKRKAWPTVFKQK